MNKPCCRKQSNWGWDSLRMGICCRVCGSKIPHPDRNLPAIAVEDNRAPEMLVLLVALGMGMAIGTVAGWLFWG